MIFLRNKAKTPGALVRLGMMCLVAAFLISSAPAFAAAGFKENLDRLNLAPPDRELLMKQKDWVQELGLNMSQEEAVALLKVLRKPGRIKFACMAPMGTTWAKYIKIIPKIVKERCGEIFLLDSYIGLSLGNDPDYVRKMAAGALESAAMTSWGMKYISKEMGVFELPFIFETYGEADYVMAKAWPYFVKQFEEKGFTLVPTKFEVGFLQIFSTNMTIKRPGDLKGTKYASWMGPVEIATLSHLGVNPVVITITEVPSSLATGVIQAGSAPTMYMVGAQLTSFTEKNGGCSGINMFYPPGGLVFHKKNILETTLAAASRDERPLLTKYIDKAMEIYGEVILEQAPVMADELRAANKKLLDHLQGQGMIIHVPTEQERTEWKNATRPLWDDLAGKVYPRELLDEIIKYKEEYRAAHPDEFTNYKWVP